VALARRGKAGDKPLVVADYTDNPGGGGYGDATAFVKGLVEAGVDSVAFHAICDPAAVQEGMRAGIGAKTTLALGGKTDPAMGGAPLALHGEIMCLTTGRFIAYGPMGGGVGVDPTRYRTVAVKSMQHFRAAFEPIARQVVLVDTGALCSEIYTPELFTRVRRPVWPLDPIPDPNAG